MFTLDNINRMSLFEGANQILPHNMLNLMVSGRAPIGMQCGTPADSKDIRYCCNLVESYINGIDENPLWEKCKEDGHGR